MKKIIIATSIITTLLSCNNTPTAQEIKAKNKTIDSLQAKLNDCQGQAKIMAEVLEKDRIKENGTNY